MTALLTITHPDGSVVAHRIAELSDADRAIVAPIAEAFMAAHDITPVELLSGLSDHVTDQAAYERVCARKGLLAL
jgi:hypothetical protein